MIRRLGLAGAILLGSIVGLARGGAGGPHDLALTGSNGNAYGNGHALVGEGVCDVDGVTTSYRTVNAGQGHLVPAVLVGGLAPTCAGAEVVVTLVDDGIALAPAASVIAADGSATVPIAPPPLVSRVDRVDVELRGGELPIPVPCSKMKLALVRIGTAGNDVVELGSKAAISYALGGDDAVRGGNQTDCIDGGPGADQISGGNQGDVLFGGDGPDRLVGGNQDDVLVGGPGIDHLDGGPGRDTCIGELTDVFVGCEKVQRP